MHRSISRQKRCRSFNGGSCVECLRSGLPSVGQVQELRETEEESYKAEEFVVQMHEEAKTFHVNLEKLLDWLGRGRRGHKDTPRKEQLRRLLDANISGPSLVRDQ